MGDYLLYIVLAAAALIYVALIVFRVVRNKKRKAKELHEEKVEKNLDIVDDVRYTMETNPVEENNDVNITFVKEDYILKQGAPVTVSVNGELKPGKYIVLSTDENQESFNIRIGIYVREYRHNQEIVLAEDDTICAVSGSIILR